MGDLSSIGSFTKAVTPLPAYTGMTPRDLTYATKFWFEPSVGGATMSSTTVVGLADLFGTTGYDLVQDTGTGPALTTENGLQVLDLTGGKYLKNAGTLAADVFGGTDTPFVVVIAIKHPTTTVDGCFWGAGKTASNAYYAGRMLTGQYRMIGYDGTNGRTSATGALETDDTVQVLSFLHNGNSYDMIQNSKRQANDLSFALGEVSPDVFSLGALMFDGVLTTASLQFSHTIMGVVGWKCPDGITTAVEQDVSGVIGYFQERYANAVRPLNAAPRLLVMAGQSNMAGASQATEGFLDPEGAYVYNVGTDAIGIYAEPIGGGYDNFDAANGGSMGGGLATGWYNGASQGALLIPFGANSSSVLEGAVSSGHSWLPADAELYTAMKTKLDALVVSPKVYYNYYDTQHLFWAEGESAATTITAGSATEADYEADLTSLASTFATDFPTFNFNIIRASTRVDGDGTGTIDDTTGYQAVRSAQSDVVDALAKVNMAYEVPIDDATLFRDTGGDKVHYNQAALNEIGRIAAETIAALE